jgi:hypothetical protein
MAAFTTRDVDRLDFWLFRDGPISIVGTRSSVDEIRAELARLGYAVHDVDLASRDRTLEVITTALRFQENFGYAPWTGDLNALNDAFRYVSFDGVTGVAFVVDGVDAAYAADPTFTQDFFDIVALASRHHLVFGHRLLAIVHGDRRTWPMPPLAATGPHDGALMWLRSRHAGRDDGSP